MADKNREAAALADKDHIRISRAAAFDYNVTDLEIRMLRINARAILIRSGMTNGMTPPKDSGKTDSPHIICINNHKPDRAEGIA